MNRHYSRPGLVEEGCVHIAWYISSPAKLCAPYLAKVTEARNQVALDPGFQFDECLVDNWFAECWDVSTEGLNRFDAFENDGSR